MSEVPRYYTTDWVPEPTECPEMDGCTIHDAEGNLKSETTPEDPA